ncbi:MAG: universal stress protein [Thermodesulfobacteriota bacterium]|nr:universal stress protein [Thermodesulfobacteriota bacterium]
MNTPPEGTNTKRLLVLLDQSERSMRTLEYLASVEPFKKISLVLYHVYSDLPEYYWDMAIEANNSKALKEVRERWMEKKDGVIKFMLDAKSFLVESGFSGDAVEVKIQKWKNGIARDILEESAMGYDAVMLRRRGMTGLKDIILGSVSSKLLSKLKDTPVMLAGTREHNKKLLVAVDESPSSASVVEFVSRLVGGYDYSVELFHVIRGLDTLNPGDPGYIPPDMFEDIKRSIGYRFETLRESLVAAGIDADRISEKIATGAGSRAEAIVEEARSGGFGTIAVGRRGVSRVEDFFMGRVCNKVIHIGQEFTVWIV